MANRIVVNISTSADWCRRPVGIVRVEREIIKAVVRHFPHRVLPVYLDKVHDEWATVAPNCFDEIQSDEWVESDDPDRKAAGVYNHLLPFHPRDGDQFVSMGSDWSFRIPDRVEKLYGNSRTIISACYDLIPLLFPEFTPGPEFYEQFNYHYRKLSHLGKSVFAISETSAESLWDFWKTEGLSAHAPPIEVVPLAAPVSDVLPQLTNSEDRRQFDDIAGDGPYVIYVSTIEPRKNHQLLLDLWRELYAERGDKCPRLLIIGMRGWGCGDLITMAGNMNAAQADKIVMKEGISDALLMQLYASALFAVFPSYFEGWGLAATEAGALGKICVVSNAGALAEATHGVMPSYHPLDFPGWKSEICRLFDDASYRRSLEGKLTATHFRRTWIEFGDEFCGKMLADT